MITDDPILFSKLSQNLNAATGEKLVSIERLRGGGNNQVYKLSSLSQKNFASKVYLKNPSDTRDRLGNEYRATKFVFENLGSVVSRPLISSTEDGLAIYEFIDGEKLESSNVKRDHVLAAAKFLIDLKALSLLPDAEHLTAASEACFSLEMAIGNVLERLGRFDHFEAKDDVEKKLKLFMNKKLKPSVTMLIDWSREMFVKGGDSPSRMIEKAERTLSPSDFGFHNAILRNGQQLVFIDFEYFGWDDPVKMISDTLLHPGMQLEPARLSEFSHSAFSGFRDHPHFERRFKAHYPIFALKWCLIILNEFLPSQLRRRQFAKNPEAGNLKLKDEQLSKAENMLYRILHEYRENPYASHA